MLSKMIPNSLRKHTISFFRETCKKKIPFCSVYMFTRRYVKSTTITLNQSITVSTAGKKLDDIIALHNNRVVCPNLDTLPLLRHLQNMNLKKLIWKNCEWTVSFEFISAFEWWFVIFATVCKPKMTKLRQGVRS